MNFGGISEEFSAFDTAKFVVVPVPYDLTSTYQAGSRKGPAAIMEASGNMELYDEELCRETYEAGIHTLPPLEIEAGGPEAMVHSVRETIAEVLAHDKVPVMLGGEHSITLGAVEAMKARYPSLSVLQLDAHADLRDSYQGTPYSHASVARRVFDLCPLVQIGIRSMSAPEAVFMKENNIITITPQAVRHNPDWIKNVCANLTEDVYVTVDVDVFDPSIMPATGTPEPGGIYWEDVIKLIKEVAISRNIRGFDVVELCPIPGMIAPDFTAAKLVYRIMGYLL